MATCYLARDTDIFSLSKSRLRENQKFRALTSSEKWYWIDLCMFLDDQQERGVIKWDLDRIARAQSCPIDALRSLVKQEVLKGAPTGMDCQPFIHVDRKGKEHTLIPAQSGPIWYSSAVVRSEYLRQLASKSGKRGGGNPILKVTSIKTYDDTPIKMSYTFNPTFIGGSKGAPKGVDQHPPPEVSPPTTPPSLPSPLSLSARANGESAPPIDASQIRSRAVSATAETFRDAKINAVAAVSRWSAMNPPSGRGWPIDPAASEDRQVYGLVEELAQEPTPIVRGNNSCSRHLLVPNAVQMLMGEHIQFKSLKYVFGCIRGKLADWARTGMDEGGSRATAPRLPPPTPRAIKSQV